MMLYAKRMRRAGFTLIEIMIVIAIIAILAGIVIPNIREARAEANLIACRKNIMNICYTIDAALIRHSIVDHMVKCGFTTGNRQFADNDGIISEYLIENGYIPQWPKCPIVPSTESPANHYRIVLYNNHTSYKTGYRITCGSWYSCEEQGHRIGHSVVNPRYFMSSDSAIAASANMPYGASSCGWADTVTYD